MAKVTPTSNNKSKRPGLSPENREKQVIAAAINLAEEQILNGTASSQVITHFLKLGTAKAELEREKLEQENELLRAKTESIRSSQRVEELYERAIKAMQRYSGHGDEEYDY